MDQEIDLVVGFHYFVFILARQTKYSTISCDD